ncbi:unnamed protein product [Linum trigynum]|uniref:Uncharacterized protein n=1 Tax=Linum trigynum TaxID=586398 RepID=A0AAV2CDA3_9ROSI
MAGGNVVAAVSQSDSSTDSDTASSDTKLSIDTRNSSGSFGLSSKELNKLKFLLISVSSSPSPSPPASPSLNHHAFSVAQHIPHFPNCVGKYILSSHLEHHTNGLVGIWILDTRASDHIACNLDLFIESNPV